VSRFQYPLMIGDLPITRDPVVLNESYDDEPSLAQAFGESMPSKVSVDEERWLTAVGAKRRRCGHVKRPGGLPQVHRTRQLVR
jgi:hypothetical protein